MRYLMCGAFCAALSFPTAGAAATATLGDLLGGGTLTEQDLVFDEFFYGWNAGGFPINLPAEDNVRLTTAVVGTSVELEVRIDPEISLGSGDLAAFFLDFSVSVAGSSFREIQQVRLFNSDLQAFGTGESEVQYGVYSDQLSLLGDLRIFDDPSDRGSQDSDIAFFSGRTSLGMLGNIQVDGGNDGAELGVFLLQFEMGGAYEPPVDPPQPGTVPLPASAILMLGGLTGLGWVSRRQRG